MATIDSEKWKEYSRMDKGLEALLPSLPKAPTRIADYASAAEGRALAAEQMKQMVQSELVKVPDWTGYVSTEIQIPRRDGEAVRALVRMRKGAPGPLFAWFHPGGWATGMPEAGERFANLLVKEMGFAFVSVGYRLAPEHVFPTAANDAVDAVHWLVKNASSIGVDLSKGFIIAGASAGANIACVAAHEAIDAKLEPKPTGVVLMSPLLCHVDAMPEEYKEHAHSWEQNKDSMILSQRDVKWLYNNYKIDPTSPLASPLIWPSHKGQPATYLQVMGMDPMRDEALIYEHVLKQAGTPTKVDVFPGLPHGAPSFLPMHPAAEKGLGDLKAGVEWIMGQKV